MYCSLLSDGIYYIQFTKFSVFDLVELFFSISYSMADACIMAQQVPQRIANSADSNIKLQWWIKTGSITWNREASFNQGIKLLLNKRQFEQELVSQHNNLQTLS